MLGRWNFLQMADAVKHFPAIGDCGAVVLPLGYMTLSTCSLICSSSSFIFTTMFCISA